MVSHLAPALLMSLHGDLLQSLALRRKTGGAGETPKTLAAKSNMGLDMHLYRSQFASPCDKETIKVVEETGTTILTPVRPTELREEIGYWRRANQIHGWFVEHVKAGEDDCRDVYVERDQLRELRRTVNEVLSASKLIPGTVPWGWTLDRFGRKDHFEDGMVIANSEVAEALLPVRQGCFFGSTAYDEEYLDILYDTLTILDAALDSPAGMEFVYRSSW